MAGMLPVAVYGLKVPPGETLIDATEIPATFRITMAAIDPSLDMGENTLPARATLKMLYEAPRKILDDSEDESEDDNEEAFMKALRDEIGSDDDDDEEEDSEDSSDDEDKVGGPSDPSKSVKARKEAAAQKLLKQLLEANSEDESEDEMDVDETSKPNGTSKARAVEKGKGKASLADLSDEDSDSESPNLVEMVLCTLDPTQTYQQALDITVHEDQRTYFKVSGTHTVYLSGNYVIPPDEDYEGSSGIEDEYDLSPDEDELDLDADESDELDDVDDPRIVELGSDDEEDEAPQLVTAKKTEAPKKQKGKNKRQAEDSASEEDKAVTIDDIISKSLKAEEPATNGDAKLSKKQLKKLKNNAGNAVEPQAVTEVKKSEHAPKQDKKVQFAKDLETGPSSSPSTQLNGAIKTDSKAKDNVKNVQGVKIEDKKMGSGPQAKKGDTLGMRYIGKLSNGKVFDANKKGPPFRFKLGAGQVIKGWDIGVAGMAVQGERRIIVPANLAYGDKRMDDIPPKSDLTFDIKLLEISKK